MTSIGSSHSPGAPSHHGCEPARSVSGFLGSPHRQTRPTPIPDVSLRGCDPFELQLAELARLPAPESAALLASLALPQAARALERLDAGVAGPLLAYIPLDHVAALCSAVARGRLPALLAVLPPRRAAWVRVALCSPAGSAARLLSDAFVQATPDTPAGIARGQFVTTALVTTLAGPLFVVDSHRRLLGVVPRPVLEAAAPDETVGTLMQPAPVAVGPDTEDSALLAALARSGGGVPIVAETGFLLGVVRCEADNAGPEQGTATVRPWWHCSQERATRLLAALILVTVMLAGLSTLDPPLHERFLLGIG